MLRIFAGPMFAGKTTKLLEHVAQLRGEFERVTVAKWSQDLRSGSASTVSTHDGTVLASDVVALDSLDRVLVDRKAPGRSLIAVDEAQFFGKDLMRLWARVAERNVARPSEERDLMVVAGLDLDFRRQRFGHVLDLAEFATADQGTGLEVRVNMLHARCFCCGEPAAYTMRTLAREDRVLVGGADIYQAACALHHSIPRGEQVAGI